MIGLATSTAIGTAAERSWLSAFRRYMAFVASASLIWEIAHLPLYSIWLTATPPELAFAVFHCTGGDILIALSSLTLALIAVGSPGWPRESRRPVLVLTVLIGVGYTIFSEWLNIEIRQS